MGDGQEHDSDPAWDAKEANDLYTLLEEEIVPQFYHRNQDGIPEQWVARIRESMSRLTPIYSASRAVRQYTEEYYLPAAATYRNRVENKAEKSQRIVAWQKQLAQNWHHLRFGEYITTQQDKHYIIDLHVYTDDINVDAIQVQLYADAIDGDAPEVHIMQRQNKLIGAVNGYDYHLEIPALRPLTDYTPRIIPANELARVPLEANHILWHH